MNFKKLFFTMAILIAGFAVNAQDVQYNWHSGIIPGSTLTSTSYGLKINNKGELFTLANFVTKGSDLTTEYLGQTFSGAYSTATGGAKNLLLTKSDLSGNLIWGVTSINGDLDLSNTMIPTNDGGIFLALEVRHNNYGKIGEGGDTLLRIKDASGVETTIVWEYPGVRGSTSPSAWVYQGVLLKLNSNGVVEWMKQTPVDYLTTSGGFITDGFNFNAVATDNEDNLYIGGALKKTIHFGTDSIAPNADESFNAFIVKLDKNGNYLAQFTSGGNSDYDYVNVLAYEDGALYAGGLIKGDADENATTFGTHSITASTNINLYAMKLSMDLSTVDWAQLYPCFREGGQVLQIKNMVVRNDNIYFTGGLNGGLGFSSTATAGDISSNGARLNGFVLKCNTSDGVCTNGVARSSTGIGVSTGMIVSADSVFQYGYDYGTKEAYLDSYDTDLKLGTKYKLIGGSNLLGTDNIAVYRDTIVITERDRNTDITFYESDTTFRSSKFVSLVAAFTFPGRNFTNVPSTPTNLTGIAEATNVNLSWAASTGDYKIAYNIYVDGIFNQKVADTTANISGLTPNTEYTFAVEAIDAAGNVSEKATTTVTTLSGVSIENREVETIKVYPNPFTDYIIINTYISNEVKIYNMNGQLLLNVNLVGGENRINVSNLPKGSYILKNGSSAVKLVK